MVTAMLRRWPPWSTTPYRTPLFQRARCPAASRSVCDASARRGRQQRLPGCDAPRSERPGCQQPCRTSAATPSAAGAAPAASASVTPAVSRADAHASPLPRSAASKDELDPGRAGVPSPSPRSSSWQSRSWSSGTSSNGPPTPLRSAAKQPLPVNRSRTQQQPPLRLRQLLRATPPATGAPRTVKPSRRRPNQRQGPRLQRRPRHAPASGERSVWHVVAYTYLRNRLHNARPPNWPRSIRSLNHRSSPRPGMRRIWSLWAAAWIARRPLRGARQHARPECPPIPTRRTSASECFQSSRLIG